jgi:energy-coupling factor transport system ATP-binding protein
MSEPAVIIRDLSFRYPKTVSGRKVTALSHISLTIQPGEFVLVTGQSGSGKSTLARCLNGLIPHATNGAMEGQVVVNGLDTRDHDVPEFASHVGMIFQDPGSQLVTGDVGSEIAFGLEIRNLPKDEIRTRMDQAAGLLRIGQLMDRPIGDLSWGERQRVAIASVLVVWPSILVMDEPFSGLDSDSAQDLARTLEELSNSGTTIIVFEHRIVQLLPLTDHLVAMQEGTIVSDWKPRASFRVPDLGKPRSLGNSSSSPAVSTRKNSPAICRAVVDPHLLRPSLSVRDVYYRYPGRQAGTLEGITLDFRPGEVTVITGANGSGKTTLLKHCNGLLTPDRGSVSLGTESLSRKTVAAAAQTVGLLNQHADYQIFESTITDEIAFGPRNLGRPEEEIRRVTGEIRNRCSLSHIDPSTPPLGLSGGEKQRVALAGILAMDTPIIILDEPTFGLDYELKIALARYLRQLSETGKTVIVATHDEEFGTACGDRFIRIAAGRVEEDYRSENPEPASGPGKAEDTIQGR